MTDWSMHNRSEGGTSGVRPVQGLRGSHANPDGQQPLSPSSQKRGNFILFWCPHCGRYTPTVQRDSGCVPVFIACRAGGTMDNGCGKRANQISLSRGVPSDAPTEPEWEWVAPFDRSRIPASENRAVEAAAVNELIIKRLAA